VSKATERDIHICGVVGTVTSGVGRHTVNDQRGEVGMMPAMAVTTMLT